MEINQVKIAVIEDDENMRLLIAQRLIQEGFQVIEAAEGNAAQALILEEQPHIVLLDWMLPGKSGMEICTALRQHDYAGIVIMVTAKAQDVDKIDAYHFGVSDYITKPFNMEVLIALLNNKVKYIVNAEKTDSIKFANMEHHPNTHLLMRDGKKVELTILENRILLYFLKNRNKVINREELMLVVWGYNSDVNTRTLDMHIVRLRKKIEVNPEMPLFVQTVRGIGYKFAVV
jgi:two-component system alkaline phosphatase synthesis response regulator PhoP